MSDATTEQPKRKKVTIPKLYEKKKNHEPIVMCGINDYPTARAADLVGGLDIASVGDSGAMVHFGRDTTIDVPFVEELIMVQAVRRGTKYAMVLADMPYMTYQVSKEEAIRNAGRFVAEGGAEVMKCEGDRYTAENIAAIVRAGIPVMGHIGMTPMTASKFGGFLPQGITAKRALELVDDARAMEDAGCFALLLEWCAAELGAYLSKTLSIPVISLGAGPYCDGVHVIGGDLFWMYDKFVPQHSKIYVNIREIYQRVYRDYINDVTERRYPEPQHWVNMSDEERLAFERALKTELEMP
ncbi:MAG: 3-methyl-2-oxobutanoate hydroxymethyltransferase [Firmicutes bacterium]|nr:3-methyl-2-oxobutanoate hydroxymethyltransferase [Bacillota bacterium]